MKAGKRSRQLLLATLICSFLLDRRAVLGLKDHGAASVKAIAEVVPLPEVLPDLSYAVTSPEKQSKARPNPPSGLKSLHERLWSHFVI